VSKNKQDIDLLYNNPHQFIEEHQTTIEIIVGNFIRSGLLPHSEKDDIVQYVNEKLIGSKIKLMQQHYNHSYFVTTYLSKVIRNLCFEYTRRHKELRDREISLHISYTDIISDDRTTTEMIINEELLKLKTVLQLFHKKRLRLELYLKVLVGSTTSEEDIKAVYPNCSKNDVIWFLKECNPDSDITLKTEKEIHVLLTEFSNKYENKQITPDSLRKWLDLKISNIIELMNGEPKQANYSKKTVKILLQKYFR
jgi:DNA-directed RNA polymerase specialized sigma24 family protein